MKSPKILVFAGSARRESFNKKLAKIAAELLEAEGCEVTFLDLQDYPLPLYHGDLEGKGGLPEPAKELKKIFAQQDGFLIASPEYNGSFSALLKNTLDWVSRTETEEESPGYVYANKVAAVVSASPGALGGIRGLVSLRMLLGYLGITVLPAQVNVSSAFNAFDENGKLVHSGTLPRLKSLCADLADYTRKWRA